MVTVRFLDPAGPNHHGDTPRVSRVDLITGDVGGPVTDRSADSNATTRTNGSEPEPTPDPRGEDPWSDLWFYSNPIFLDVR